MRDGMSHLYHQYKLHFDIYMSGRKQTHSTYAGVLVVCIKDDLSSLPICIFCKDIMPLFSIHKDGSGYPAWLLDEERQLQDSSRLKSLMFANGNCLYVFFFIKKKCN